VWCDTAYAFQGGSQWTLSAILDEVASYHAGYVTVTGGEPLAQPECLPLLTSLCDAGYEVSLETSGALPVDAVDPRVVKVMDLKAPGSGEVHRNCYDNVAHLTRNDQVKFVICNKQDYDWAKLQCDQYGLYARVSDVLLSPGHETLAPRELAEWILADRLPVRLQVQLHKYLWNNAPGH